MKIAVIGDNTPNNYQKLDKKLNELIEKSGIYLFYILCGRTLMTDLSRPSLGYSWAINNGAPVQWIPKPTPAYLFKEADYIIFFYDGSAAIRNLIMQYKMLGKHGTVINI